MELSMTSLQYREERKIVQLSVLYVLFVFDIYLVI